MSKLVRLDDIAEVVRGVTFSREVTVDMPLEGYVPVLRAGNIQEGALILEEDLVWVPENLVTSKQLLRENDLVMCTSSGSTEVVGKVAPFLSSDWVGSFGAFCAVIRPMTNKCDPSYLKHFLQSDGFLRWARQSLGANIKNIRKSEMESFELKLPPLEEQKRIAAILDKADSLRRKRAQAIALADDFLRATFIDMFGSLDDSNNQLVNLGEVVDIDAPMVDPRLEEYLDMPHIGPDRIEKYTGRLLPALTAREEGLISKKFIFDGRYVLYSKIRPYLRKCALPDFEGLCSADMYPVRPRSGLATREFIWALLLSDCFDTYVGTLPDRANIPKLNRVELNYFEFNLPPIELQVLFSEKVTAVNKTLKAQKIFDQNLRLLSNALAYF